MSKAKKKAEGQEMPISQQDSQFVQSHLKLRKDEASFVHWIKKPKNKGFEDRLLVIGKYRIYSITPKHKVAREGHLTELTAIESLNPQEVTLSFEQWKISCCTPHADDIINNLRLSYEAAFPGTPAHKRFKLKVEPDTRLRDIPESDGGVCGGFNFTYQAMCDYFNTPVREDLCWDISHLFTANNIKIFNLEDFEQPITPLDLAAVLGALRYNTWFTGLIARSMPLDPKRSFQDIAKLLSMNTNITKLVLSEVGMVKDTGACIAEALKTNPETGINVIDLSKNTMDDRTVAAFAATIGTMSHGLIELDVSHCNIPKIALSGVCQALRKNIYMYSSLSKLNLSHNVLDAEGSSSLASWLASTNKVEELNISHTNANLESIMPALVRGCFEIKSLNMSGNKLTAKGAQTLVTFLQSSGTLNNLNLSNTGLAPESMDSIIKAIGSNAYLTDFDLKISNNKLGAAGANLLGGVNGAKNIIALNVSENEFGDEGIISFCSHLENNTTLKRLDLSRNFSMKPTKVREKAINAFVTGVLDSEMPIEHLIFQGGKNYGLRLDILSILDAVGSNEKLISLDISGHLMGNKGAIALGKNLQINTKLQSLEWEDNNTTLLGFTAVAAGLEKNKSLKEMVLPVIDISNAIRADDPVKVSKICSRLQSILARNQNPKSLLGAGGTSGINQLSFLASGEREHTERLRLKVKSQNRDLSLDQMLVMEDVEKNDSILSSLHGLAEAHQLEMASEVTKKLKELASEIMPVIDNHFHNMVAGIIELMKDSYKSLEPDAIRRVNTSISFGAQQLDPDTVEKILADAASAEISSKATEAFISALEITTDYIYEKLGDGLQAIIDDVKREPQRQSMALFDANSVNLEDEFAKLANEKSSSLPSSSPSPQKQGVTPPPQNESSPSGSKRMGVMPRSPNIPPANNNNAASKPATSNSPSLQSTNSPTPTPTPSTPPPSGSGSGGGSGKPPAPSPAGRGKIGMLMPGLDPTKMIGGMGGGPRPPIPRTSVQPEPDPSPPPSNNIIIEEKKDEKKAAPSSGGSGGGGGLFGRKPAAKPPPGKNAPAPPSRGSVKPGAAKPGSAPKVAEPSGDTSNLEKMEKPNTPELNHMTRERPMIQRKRKPPSRRPRNLNSNNNDDDD